MVAQWKAISSAFDKVTTEVPHYQNVWLCDETFARAIRARYKDLDTAKFDYKALNRALSKKYSS